MIDSLAFPLAFRLFFLRVSIDFHRFAFGFPVVLPWFFLCFARAFSLPLRVRFFPSFFLCFPLSTRPTTNLRPTPVRFVRSPRTKRTGAKEKEKDGNGWKTGPAGPRVDAFQNGRTKRKGKGRKRKETRCKTRPSWTTSGCVSKRANHPPSSGHCVFLHFCIFVHFCTFVCFCLSPKAYCTFLPARTYTREN